MTEEEALQILTRTGALLKDSHIVYTSGRHGSDYVDKDAVYPHSGDVSHLCLAMAEKFVRAEVAVVIAPAVGGVILSQWVAHHLSELTRREIAAVYAEKAEGGFVIRRGYNRFIRGERTLVVEDVLTTGGSVKRVVEAVRSVGGKVVGVAALCNRGGVTKADLGDVPHLEALVNLRLDSWEASACPLCARKIPINTEVGKGRG